MSEVFAAGSSERKFCLFRVSGMKGQTPAAKRISGKESVRLRRWGGAFPDGAAGGRDGRAAENAVTSERGSWWAARRRAARDDQKFPFTPTWKFTPYSPSLANFTERGLPIA